MAPRRGVEDVGGTRTTISQRQVLDRPKPTNVNGKTELPTVKLPTVDNSTSKTGPSQAQANQRQRQNRVTHSQTADRG